MPLPAFKYYDYEPYLPSSTTKADALIWLVDILGWASKHYAECRELRRLSPDIAKQMPRNGGGVLVRLAYQKAMGGPADYTGEPVLRFATIAGAGLTSRAVFDRWSALIARTGTIEPPLWGGWEAEDSYLWITN